MESIGEQNASESNDKVSPNDRGRSHKAAKRKAGKKKAIDEVEKTVESFATTVILEVSYDGRHVRDFMLDEEQEPFRLEIKSTSEADQCSNYAKGKRIT